MSDGGNRYIEARRRGVVDRAIALPHEAKENDRLARLAEDHIGELMGLERLPSPDGVADRGDFQHGPWVVDVKWTPRADGRLLVQLKQSRKDLYILVVGASPEEFSVAGWAWRADVEACQRDLGHGQTYALDQWMLRSLESWPLPQQP